ncbi:MAG: hypothetical protein HYW57_05060 [Ignavibacteriales bacterium]|nr:hypothetical protein [Ignavibacteriales bacterium]
MTTGNLDGDSTTERAAVYDRRRPGCPPDRAEYYYLSVAAKLAGLFDIGPFVGVFIFALSVRLSLLGYRMRGKSSDGSKQ